MEDSFTLTWEDANTVQEEVICGIDNDNMIPNDGEFTDVCEEVVVGNDENVGHDQPEGVMYLTEDNVLVMQQPGEDFMEVAEEVVTEQWTDELVVGSEEHVGDTTEQTSDDVMIPLSNEEPYTLSRPYPCDFCSRRFRKKANLMNHMVAHQTDRPHGCNLCGVRYIRKCDLMNHLKIHAYVPETDNLEDELQDDSDMEKVRKRPKPVFGKKKKPKSGRPIKEEYESDGKLASGSRAYNYVDEDVRLMEAMENNPRSEYNEYMQESQSSSTEPRYPVTDPRKPFVCQHCGIGFAREKALGSHSRVHGGDSPFECRRCSEMFWDAAKMRDHIKLKHAGVDDDYLGEDDDFSEEENNKFGEYFCSTCGMSFHRQDLLKRHQRLHIKEEYVNEAEFGHICNVCGESFAEALDLLAHAEVHARTTDFRCMICGEQATDEQALAHHVTSKHTKTAPPNTCLQCGRTCKDRRTLLKHSLEHSREKSFLCNKCQKTFHNKARLKRHMLSHRNKNVSCDVCGEDFPDGRSLMNHRHSHSSVSGRQFPCRECGKTFGSRSSQQIHIRIHTGERPYGCRFCWKAFADGGTLRKHERIHTGEKPYACAVCPRAFNQRVVLREHIRSHHSGPDPNYTHSMTPYCCTVCSDMFSTSQDLIVHLIHHCDLNTAMRRQPQVGPRKYKRRRKLKPHELELISNNLEDDEDENEDDDIYSDSEDDERRKPKKKAKKPKQTNSNNSSASANNMDDSYTDMYNSFSSAIENINSIMNTKPVKPKKKTKEIVPSRPKMIHTQKTKVAVESNDGSKIRHKTRTLITRTQPTELKSATGDRIRPRTKNVSYHILNPDKLPIATFPTDDDTEQAVNSLLETELESANGLLSPKADSPRTRKSNHSLPPGRHIIGPGQIVKFVKSGMIVSKKKVKQEIEEVEEEEEEEEIIEETIEEQILDEHIVHEEVIEEEQAGKYESNVEEEMIDNVVYIKQEATDNPLNEFAELSMQHAQNIFKCEMCSAIFSDRAQLLDHVPIHI